MKFLISIAFVFFITSISLAQDKTLLAQTYFKRAQNSAQKKDTENTINYLNQSKELLGGIVSDEVAIFGANFFFDINQQKEAQEYLKAFFELNPDKTSEAYNKMLLLYTDNLDVIDDPSKFDAIKKRKELKEKEAIDNAYAKAKANFEANKYKETIASVEEYFSLLPSKTSKTYTELSGILTEAKEKLLVEELSLSYDLAKNAFAENKFDEAIISIEKYLSLSPNESSKEFVEMTALLQKAKEKKNLPLEDSSETNKIVKDSLRLDKANDSIKKLPVVASKKDSVIAEVELGSKVYTKDVITFMMIEEAPIFPGCVGTLAETKSCFEKQTKEFFANNFDKNLISTLGLPPGKKRIFINFVIDVNGAVTNIEIKSIDSKITAEATRVLNMLPKMKPAKLVGKPIGVNYSFLFTFNTK